MKKWWVVGIIIVIIVLGFVFISNYFDLEEREFEDRDGSDSPKLYSVEDLGGFCGSSTRKYCEGDEDCVRGGCSGEICAAISDEVLGFGNDIVGTCEFLECYDPESYAVYCSCVNSKCQWKKQL